MLDSGHMFFAILGGVLCANMLTVSFIWGIMNVNKRDEEKRDIPSVYWIGLMLPFGFAIMSLAISFGWA